MFGSRDSPSSIGGSPSSDPTAAAAPASPPPQGLPGEGRLRIRCVTRDVYETRKIQTTVKVQVPAPAQPPTRQTDVYVGTEGRDARGRNVGITAQDSIDRRLQMAARAPPPPTVKNQVITQTVKETRQLCTQRFTAELRVSLPANGDDSREPELLSLEDLNCTVKESNTNF